MTKDYKQHNVAVRCEETLNSRTVLIDTLLSLVPLVYSALSTVDC